MAIIKTFFAFIISFILGFGIWYLIFWFITGERDLFVWHFITKILYLIFGFTSFGGIIEEVTKD